MKFPIISLILLLSIAISSHPMFAQTKRRPINKSKATALKTGKLDVEAGLLFKNGDSKPVVRAVLYLLKENAENIVRTPEHFAAWKADDKYGIRKDEIFEKWSLWTAGFYINYERMPEYGRVVRETLSQKAVQTQTTGFDGKATFEGVPVGDYYIFSSYSFGDRVANAVVWNVPVNIKAGANKVVLANDNAVPD